jgi:hypothetical protein
MSNFRSAKEEQSSFGKTWNPGFDDQENPRINADANDFIEAYFVGTKENVGRHGSTVHMFETKSGEKISIWGTKVLNDQIEDVVRKHGVGVYCRVLWMGRKMLKGKENLPASRLNWKTDYYQDWDFQYDPSDVKTGGSVAAQNKPYTPEPSRVATTNIAMPDTLDELPSKTTSSGKVNVNDDLPF